MKLVEYVEVAESEDRTLAGEGNRVKRLHQETI